MAFGTGSDDATCRLFDIRSDQVHVPNLAFCSLSVLNMIIPIFLYPPDKLYFIVNSPFILTVAIQYFNC